MEASKDRTNERETHNPLLPINENSNLDIIKTSKSVCRIISGEINGTGFLIKLYKDNKELYCLLTNEHVIEKEMIETNQKITIYYDIESESREIILNKDQRFIKQYKNINIDATLIEILEKDNINKKYFLLPYMGNNDIINNNIYIIQYPHRVLSYSKGEIINIEKNEITHDVSTKPGSSGSPIFLEGTKLVIGIHKQDDKKKNVNYGDLLYPIIKDLEQQSNENIKHEDNIINDNYEEEGKIIYKSGSYYIGQKKNGKAHGKGKLQYFSLYFLKL